MNTLRILATAGMILLASAGNLWAAGTDDLDVTIRVIRDDRGASVTREISLPAAANEHARDRTAPKSGLGDTRKKGGDAHADGAKDNHDAKDRHEEARDEHGEANDDHDEAHDEHEDVKEEGDDHEDDGDATSGTPR